MVFGEVTRYEWGAQESKAKTEMWNPIMKVMLIFGTESRQCHNKEECIRVVRDIQITDMYHKRLPDLNYNFLIGGDRNVYEGRGFSRKPSTMADYVPNSLVIAYIGDFAVEDPPPFMEEIFAEFCRLYVKEGKIHPSWRMFYIRGYG